MLRILRERATSWILRGILILVAVTFISWGGYRLVRERKETYAARVNGVVIDQREYSDAFQNVIKQYRDALGSSRAEKMIEELQLREKVLDDLIARVLILQEGKRLELTIHDEELREAIESIPLFQMNGQFDQRNYERFLRSNRMTTEDFERLQRETLMFAKVVNLIKLNGGKVSEEEIWETYLFENEKINLTFLKVATEAFKSRVDVNEVEIKDYFQKHQEEFRIPTFLRIQYLIFRPSDMEGRVQVPSDEIKRYYDLHQERFITPKRVKAREILIKVDPNDPPEKIGEKWKKGAEVLEKAKKTKDFASLANQYSESNTAPQGGDMGWFQRGTFEEAVEKVLFSMKSGDLSPVVKGGNGFYVFKVEDVIEEKRKPFEEVKDQILQAIKKEKAKREASRKADDAFYSLFRSRDLEGFSREKNIPIKTTGFFKEGDEIPEIGKDPSFHSGAFSLKVGEISPVVAIPPNFYILKLIDKKESRIPSLDEVKEGVKQKLIQMKCDEKARQVAEELLGKMRAGKAMKDLAREQGFSMEETGFFMRAGGIVPKIGPSGEFMAILSSLTEKSPVPKEVIQIKNGYVVVKLSGIEPADQQKFPSLKRDLGRRLASQKQEESFQNWLQQLRSKAKIEINKDVL